MTNTTFQQYIEADLARAVLDHSLHAQRDCEGYALRNQLMGATAG